MCGRRWCSTHERATIAERSGCRGEMCVHARRTSNSLITCWAPRQTLIAARCEARSTRGHIPSLHLPLCPSVSLQPRPVAVVVLEDLDINSALRGCARESGAAALTQRLGDNPIASALDVPAVITVRIYSPIRSPPPLSQIHRDRGGLHWKGGTRQNSLSPRTVHRHPCIFLKTLRILLRSLLPLVSPVAHALVLGVDCRGTWVGPHAASRVRRPARDGQGVTGSRVDPDVRCSSPSVACALVR
jgi:hypothetical protein